MQCHEVDYKILGDDLQAVEIELDPGETIIAEAGAMSWMDEGIDFETRLGDGSAASRGFMSSLMGAAGRAIAGESVFMTHFTNRQSGKKLVTFAAPYPGKITALDMAEFGGEVLCQKEAFLCAAKGTSVSIALNKRFGAGLFGGEGFILEKLTGDGMAFLHAGGTVVEKQLSNETLLVDTGCLVAFSPSINYSIQRAGNLKSMLFGGEGLFLATLKGTGTVYLQSLPFSRLADRILQNAPSTGGNQTGEGSVLGTVGRILGGKSGI